MTRSAATHSRASRAASADPLDAAVQRSPARLAPYSGRFGEVALHRHVGELLEVYERQGLLIAIPVPNGAMLAGSNPTQRARRAVRMKNDRQIRPGVSDWLVYLKNGPLLAIELKVGKNKPTDEQAAFAAQVELMGGSAFVCRSIDEVMTAIDRGGNRRAA